MSVTDEAPPPDDNDAPPPRRAAVVRRIDRKDEQARQVPHNLEAERALLGAMLLSKEAIDSASEVRLGDRDFYSPNHGHVFAAILSLYGADKPVDAITVVEELRRSGSLDAIGGPAEIVSISGTASVSSAAHYAQIIADHALLRRHLAALSEATDRLYDYDVDGALVAMQRAVDLGDEATAGTHSWQPVDLEPIVTGDQLRTPPSMMLRSDGQNLLYPGKIHAFNAESESGKSMLALWVCAERIVLGEHALYIDFEDDANGVTERLLGMEVEAADIVAMFHYVRPDDPFDLAAAAHIARVLEQFQPAVVVLDGVTEAMVMNDWDLLDNGDIARFYAALPKRIARSGAGVVMIDHVPKIKEKRGKGGLGGQHKRAGVDGASYNLEVVKPFGRGLDGLVRLTVDKDRGGFIRPASLGGEHAADIRIESHDGRLEVHIDAPSLRSAGGDEDDKEWKGPLQCMEAVTEFFRKNPGDEFSKNGACEVLRAHGLSYKDRTLGDALERLAANGVLTVRSGPRRSRLFRYANSEEPRGIDLDL